MSKISTMAGSTTEQYNADPELTKLFEYADKQNVDAIKRSLLAGGIDINKTRPEDGMNLLYLAVKNNLYELVDLLVHHGADVNIMITPRRYDTKAPLHIAALPHISAEIFKLLIDNGALVNAQEPHTGNTPLMNIFRVTKPNLNLDSVYDKVQMLLKNGADVNIRNYNDYICLHLLKFESFGTFPDDETIVPSANKILELLLQYGVDINARDMKRDTVLHTACRDATTYLIDFLLNNGADVTPLLSTNGESTLHQLLRLQSLKWEGHEETCIKYIKTLVNKGVDINCSTFSGETVLHILCEDSKCKDIFDTVIALGGDINARYLQGRTVLHGYIAGHNLQRLVIQAMCPHEIEEFEEKGKEFLQVLLSYGLDIDAQDINGCSPLHAAVEYVDSEQVSWLLSLGADVNSTDSMGRTALHHLILSNNETEESDGNSPWQSLLQSLIKYNISIDHRDKNGCTALDYIKFMDEGRQKFVAKFINASWWSRAVCYIRHNILGYRDKWQCYISKKTQLERHFLLPEANTENVNTDAPWQTCADLVHDILYSQGIGQVEGIAEFMNLRKQVDELITKVAKEMSRQNSLFHFDASISGSTSERTKIGLPDEFDYLLFVEGLSDILEPDDSDTEPGYVRLRLKQGHHCPPEYQQFLDEFDCLDSVVFTSYYYQCVLAVMQKPHIWADLDLYWDYGGIYPEDLQRLKQSNFYIQLKHVHPDFGIISLSVDFVPVIRLPPGWWPREGIDPTENLIKNNPGKLCVVIKKFLQIRGQHSNLNQMRISTSELETSIFRSLSNNERMSYVLIKSIKNLCKNVKKGFRNWNLSKIVSTYMVKNAVFSALQFKSQPSEDDPLHMSDEQEIVQFAVTVLEIIQETVMEKKHLPSFFFPKLNLVEGVPRDLISNLWSQHPNSIQHLINKLKLR